MSRLIIFTILLIFSITVVAAQKRTKTPVRKIKPPAAQTQISNEIAESDWKILTDALKREDWQTAIDLARQNFRKLPADNEKKQLAQLRYIYLYALAGKIISFNERKEALEAEKTWTELDRVMETFIGKEFVLPPRTFSSDCNKKLNYICPVRNTPHALRITATNREGNAIHSFDYILFDQPLETAGWEGKEIFLGGILQKAEYNEDFSKPWILRLFFTKGFFRVNAR